MVYLRKLEKKDAPLMLEWMHDINITKNFRANFMSRTLSDCENFIQNALDDKYNLHMAISSEKGEYLGTVSLKEINPLSKSAEFGIVIRQCAMGKGISQYGMKQIINIGFQQKQLDIIYWCVDPQNLRAIRFYEKNGYQRIQTNDITNLEIHSYTKEEIKKFIWYCQKKNQKIFKN